MAKKIMVVDDDPQIISYLTTLFSDNGYDVCSASDGEVALSVLEKEHPDCITLDLEMPNEWGPRFYRKMSKDPDFKKLPVIVISGLAGIHLAIPGAVASFKKPFDPNKLLETIRTTLETKAGS